MKFNRIGIVSLLVLALAHAAAPVHFKGKVINIAEGKLALETADGNVLTLYVKATSHFVEKGKTIALAQLRENDTIDVDVEQNAKGSFVIIEARLAARTDVDEEAGVPKMRRGAPTASTAPRTVVPLTPESPRERAETAAAGGDGEPRRELHLPEYTAAEKAAMGAGGGGRSHSGDPRMELIDRAQAIAGEFIERLPNYVCQQYTTRFQSPGNSNWQALDVVSANVVYEDGHEDYRNIAINGKAQGNKKMEEIGGSTSSGEFGTILINLFHPSTQAKFKFVKEEVTSRVTTAMYDFTVAKANSNWNIHDDTTHTHVEPAYQGTVWIDVASGRVMHIFMETQNMPEDFKIKTVETEIRYDYVNLGPERFLLPVKSESISCWRDQAACSRNVIEWRNYHKYLGESKIIFDAPKPEKDIE